MITKQDLLSAGYVECDIPHHPMSGEPLFYDSDYDSTFDGIFCKDIHGNDFQTFTVYQSAHIIPPDYSPDNFIMYNTAKAMMDVHTYGYMEVTIDYPDTIPNVEAFFLKFYNTFCSTF